MWKNTMGGIESQTHIIRRQPLQVGPHCKRISKAQVQPWNDKNISNSQALKRKKKQVNTVCKNYNV